MQYNLLLDNDAPTWSIRPYIKTGYRNKLSFRQCISSLFKVHNEIGNVWTHVIGLFIYLYILIFELFRNH